MSDTSRFPSGVLIEQSLDEARPVDTLVTNEGTLYRSTDAVVATYAAIGGVLAGQTILTGTLSIGSPLGEDSTIIPWAALGGEEIDGSPAWAIRIDRGSGGSVSNYVKAVEWVETGLEVILNSNVGGDAPDVSIRWFVLVGV